MTGARVGARVGGFADGRAGEPASCASTTSRRIVIARRWDRHPPRGGTAVVIDVIRFSTTVCALLQAKRRRVWVAEDPVRLSRARDLRSADIFSEIEFKSPGRRFDNSPDRALTLRDSTRPAYVTTTTGSKALWASRAADRVVIGCFANFERVLTLLRRSGGDIWLVPAASPGRRGTLEDELCAQAFRDALAGDPKAAEEAIQAICNSPRIAEFLRFRPKTGRRDLNLCLGLNRFPWVPVARFDGRLGVRHFARIRRGLAIRNYSC